LQLPCWVFLFGSGHCTSENLLLHWLADATGKKTGFQGAERFFCYPMLLLRQVALVQRGLAIPSQPFQWQAAWLLTMRRKASGLRMRTWRC